MHVSIDIYGPFFRLWSMYSIRFTSFYLRIAYYIPIYTDNYTHSIANQSTNPQSQLFESSTVAHSILSIRQVQVASLLDSKRMPSRTRSETPGIARRKRAGRRYRRSILLLQIMKRHRPFDGLHHSLHHLQSRTPSRRRRRIIAFPWSGRLTDHGWSDAFDRKEALSLGSGKSGSAGRSEFRFSIAHVARLGKGRCCDELGR